MTIATYQLHSPKGSNLVTTTGQYLIGALRASEAKIGTRVTHVEFDIVDPATGEQFLLVLTRLSVSGAASSGTQASGGEQSGGSIASPGAVPAATTLPTTKEVSNTKKKR